MKRTSFPSRSPLSPRLLRHQHRSYHLDTQTCAEAAATAKVTVRVYRERLKSWGRLVSLPDPESDQPGQKKTTKGKGKTTARGGRPGRRGKRTRLYVGSLEPLLVARRRRRSASPSDANAGHDGDEDLDIDADGDTDDGIWPGEYLVPTIVVTEPDTEPEMVGARITPEEGERAIGAAFAIGTAVA